MSKILIAIDDTAVREFVSRGLTNAGHEFLVPEDGLQALEVHAVVLERCLLGREGRKIATSSPYVCLRSPNRRATSLTPWRQVWVEFVKLWVEQGQERVDLQPTIAHRSSSTVPWSNLEAVP